LTSNGCCPSTSHCSAMRHGRRSQATARPVN